MAGITGLMVKEQKALAEKLMITVGQLKDYWKQTGSLPTSQDQVYTTLGIKPTTIAELFPSPPSTPTPIQPAPIVGPQLPTPTPTPTPVPTPVPTPTPQPVAPTPIQPPPQVGAQTIKQTVNALLNEYGFGFSMDVKQQLNTIVQGFAADGYYSLAEQDGLRDILMQSMMAMYTNAIIKSISDAFTTLGIQMTGPNDAIMGSDVALDNYTDYDDFNNSYTGWLESLETPTPSNPGGNNPGGNNPGGNNPGGNNPGGNDGDDPEYDPTVDIDKDAEELKEYFKMYNSFINTAKMTAKSFGNSILESYYESAYDKDGNFKTLMGIGQNKFEMKYEKQLAQIDEIKATYMYMMMAPKFEKYTKTYENLMRIYDDSVSSLENRTGLSYDKASREARSQARIAMIGGSNKNFDPEDRKNKGKNLISMYML